LVSPASFGTDTSFRFLDLFSTDYLTLAGFLILLGLIISFGYFVTFSSSFSFLALFSNLEVTRVKSSSRSLFSAYLS